MKRDQAGKRKRRIILFYSIGVMIPGIILGYMAFRGILNDEAIREKESRARLEQVSENFFSHLDSALLEIFIEAENPQTSQSKNILLNLSEKTGQQPEIISHQLLYLPEQYLGSQSHSSTSNQALTAAQSLEFTSKDLPASLSKYAQLADFDPDPDIRIKALIGQARVFLKLDQAEKAIERYRTLSVDFPTHCLNNRIPVKAMALNEIAKIQSDQKDQEGLSESLIQLLNSTLHPDLDYSESHLRHILTEIKSLYNFSDPTIDSLLNQVNLKATETQIISRVLQNSSLVRDNSLRHRLDLDEDIFITPMFEKDLVVLFSKLNSDQKDRLIALSLLPIASDLMDRLIPILDPDNKLEWGLNGLSDHANTTIDFGFPEGYPNWKLSLYENQPGLLASLLSPERGVFILIFVFITLMLIVGLFFTLHTLNQEIRLSQLKSDFIANVSHELKSPLTSIRQRAELLTDNRVVDKQKPSYYSLILEQSEHLSHLIENILDFSRIEDDRKKYRFEETDINKTIDRVIKVFSHLHINSNFTIDFTPDKTLPKIKIDDEAMQQVIFNLVDNAAKFSGASRRIEILLQKPNTEYRIPSTEILIGVQDHGLGISKTDQTKIFDRFYRGEQGREMGIKGSGIGLTICQRIVEVHGGTLELESELEKGSTFWIHLPLIKS